MCVATEVYYIKETLCDSADTWVTVVVCHG